MDKVLSFMLVVLHIRGNGSKICQTEREHINGSMNPGMRVFLFQEKNMVLVNFNGLIEVITRVVGTKTILKGRAHFIGVMEGHTKVNGKITKCMAREFILGLTKGSTKVSIIVM